jgi:type IV pilus assembly protein PilY1
MHSWTSTFRRLGLVLAASSVIGATPPLLGDPADNDVACCQLTTSLVNDVLRGKDVSGDERFFSAEGAPPNIHFLVDVSTSMRELPQLINSNHGEFFTITTGCANPRLDAFQVSRGWDPATAYPVPDPGTGLGGDTVGSFNNLFQDDKYYSYMTWADSTNPTPTFNTKEDACKGVPNWSTTGAAEYTACLDCLMLKGYYKTSDAKYDPGKPVNPKFMFWGRFLNFNPPKYVTARAVLKQVIKDMSRVRAGMSIFAGASPSTTMLKPQNPACDQIIKDASSFDSNRAAYINSINTLKFNTSTPLARSLLNVGYYFTSHRAVYESDFGFGTDYGYPTGFENATLTSPTRSVCWGCQVSSVIIITDGEPSSDTVDNDTLGAKIRAKNGGPVYCPNTAADKCGSATLQDMGTDAANPGDDNENYYLDDVAKLLYEQDLQRNTPPVVKDFNTAGKQSLITYTVGFGINSNLLKNTAVVGGGLYYTADDAASLKAALLDIINNVQTRATSFSSPASSQLAVRSAGSTLIPRFKPARNKAAPWQGFLYHFKQGEERILGPGGTCLDLNGDGDCKDTFMVDKDNQAVIENDDGDFVKLMAPLTPAKPFWEAGAMLKPSGDSTVWTTRRIYTIVDGNGDGKVDFKDTPIEFSEANAAVLQEYLGISNNPSVCSDLATKLGVPSLTPLDCAKLVIRWYRGADALNGDPTRHGYDRPFLLHDIFHASPVSVEPPFPRRMCSSLFTSQCIPTLFSGATTQQSDYTLPGKTNVPAYDRFHYEHGERDKVVLVGSNGGMLHAFHNGRSKGTQDDFTGQFLYDEGTGTELWAFIPPDLLPKLRPNLGKHGYFVDGSAMVREVWLDGVGGGSADGVKQVEEFRTVAVVGTGRGGVHRFALDLTRLLGKGMVDGSGIPTGSLRVPNQAGDFLWMWPQPCDPLSLQVGESFTNISPRNPPIGPVALSPDADDALRAKRPGTVGAAATPWSIVVDSTKPAEAGRERWIVALNGGYDQSMARGRGLAFVDLATGHTVWSFFHGDGQPRSEHLRYPIGAGLAPLDINNANTPQLDADYLWDTVTVGDYGGQLWTLRFMHPGDWNPATERVTNWKAARSFRVANMAPMSGKTGDAEALRAPFSYMTNNVIQPEKGWLRTFLGTGDRENLLEKGTVCRLGNPRACAVQGCTTNTSLTIARGGSTVLSTQASFTGYHYAGGTTTVGTGGNACAGAQVTLSWTNNPGGTCTNNHDGTIDWVCDGDSSTWRCREETNTWTALNFEESARPYPQRFYGIYTYGGTSMARRFNSEAEAAAYDSTLLTDVDLTNVGQFDAATGTADKVGAVAANPADNGWFIEYAQPTERTGNSGLLANGCMLWESFEPSGASGAVCSTTGTNVGRLYQANYTTGLANCAVGFYDKAGDTWARFIQHTTIASPAELAPQLVIGGGEFSRTLPLQGPGVSDPGGGMISPRIRTTDDAVKSLYQIELDRKAHNCRHEGTDCN